MESQQPNPMTETPVRRTLQLSNNVFFFNPRNRERVNGLRTPLEIATVNTMFNQSLFAGMITIVIAAAAYIALPYLWWLIIPIAIMAALFQPYLIVAQANGRINDRVNRGGEFIVGEILACAGGVRGGRTPQFQVTTTYTFPTAGGVKLAGTSTQIRPELDGKQLPVPGTPVVVLYFSDSEYYLL